METRVFTDDASGAADIIRSGGLVAVPTETVYGLACSGLDARAVRKLYDIKGRPSLKPLSLMVAGAEALDMLCADVPRAARLLAERFWPGPVTLVLRASDAVPDIVRAGGGTVGLRCPYHEKTLALLREAGVPLAAPSANPSGAPAAKNARTVLEYFGGRIDAVIDGGECGIGVESTVLDLSRTPYTVLRRGALSEEDILDALVDSMTVVGITGGSGCGKTTALGVLAGLGAEVIDCDAVYHELTGTSAELKGELCARFGEVYDGDALDRKKLGAMVFSDARALLDLNAITHKFVSREVTRRLRGHAARGGTLAAIDAIALIEGSTGGMCSVKFGVTAPAGARVARLVSREGVTEEYAKMRIAAQKPDSFYEEHCDYILRNDGDIESFRNKCKKIFTEVLDK